MYARMSFPTVNQVDKIAHYPAIARTRGGFIVLVSHAGESQTYKKIKDAKDHLKQYREAIKRNDKIYGKRSY